MGFCGRGRIQSGDVLTSRSDALLRARSPLRMLNPSGTPALALTLGQPMGGGGGGGGGGDGGGGGGVGVGVFSPLLLPPSHHLPP